MRVIKNLLLLYILIPSISLGQVGETKQVNAKNKALLGVSEDVKNDLMSLRNLSISQINSPVGRSLALVEIGKILWAVDKEEAKRSLREAYRSTLPSEGQNDRKQPENDRARIIRENIVKSEIRLRILEIIKSDKEFSTELFGNRPDKWNRIHAYETYGNLIAEVIDVDSKRSAADLILSLESVAPFAIAGMGPVINEIARTDRALADSLIIQTIQLIPYFEDSPDLPVVLRGLSEMLVPRVPENQTSQPTPAVVRAYVAFMIDYLNRMGHADVSFLKRNRSYIIRSAELSSRYAPDLMPQLLVLEKLSRNDNESPWIPNDNSASNEIVETGSASEQSIMGLIRRGEFTKARDRIADIKDSDVRARLLDKTNEENAKELVKNGDLPSAEKLIEDLRDLDVAVRLTEKLILGHLQKGSRERASDLVSALVVKLNRTTSQSAEEKPTSTETIGPAEANKQKQAFSTLDRLFKNFSDVDDRIALQLLDAIVSLANRSKIDTALGFTGIDYRVIKKLARNNPERVRQAAFACEDPLSRILILIKIDEAKIGSYNQGNAKNGTVPIN